jgi:hyperosmotically inducible protein
MKLSKVLLAVVISATLGFVSCGPKDADIKTAIDAKISATPDMAGANASVTDGVATISGMVKDEAAKAMMEKEIAGIKGVKSVVNNVSVAPPPPPPPAPVVIAADDPLSKAVADAVKDHPTVKADVKDGVVTLTGEIKKDELKKLMPMLQSLKPKKVDNKLTVN